MNTYLAIITTVLVITQIIRVVQNGIQLSKHEQFRKDNDEILERWKYIEFCLEEIIKMMERRH